MHQRCRAAMPPSKKYGFFFLLMLIFLINSEHDACAATYGLNFSYGRGKPDHLTGYRLAWEKFWPFSGFPESPLNLSGYWDLSFAHWQTTPPLVSQPRSITILAASPIVRLQTQKNYVLGAKPYIELGIGASFLSNNHLGHRNLGSQFAFQDLLGAGLRWGISETWSLSYHYLHYSNAGLSPPNQGIDVKQLMSLGYQF